MYFCMLKTSLQRTINSTNSTNEAKAIHFRDYFPGCLKATAMEKVTGNRLKSLL